MEYCETSEVINSEPMISNQEVIDSALTGNFKSAENEQIIGNLLFRLTTPSAGIRKLGVTQGDTRAFPGCEFTLPVLY